MSCAIREKLHEFLPYTHTYTHIVQKMITKSDFDAFLLPFSHHHIRL